MQTYQLFTDATADIPDVVAKKIGLNIIPMDFILGDREYSHYVDERELSSKDFYNFLRDGEHSSTVQINIVRFFEHFEPVLESGQDILYICFSSALSGTYQSSLIALSELKAKYPDRKILSIDSKSASIGEGVLCHAAAIRKLSGYSFDKLANWIMENRDYVVHQFVVDDLDHLRRGGRISPIATVIGSALCIKPFLKVDNDGALFVYAKIRGRKKSLESLFEEMKINHDPEKDPTIFIGHGDCLEDANKLADLIFQIYPSKNVILTNMGPIIGSHTGANTLALAFLGISK